MDNFSIIYKILNALEKSMDCASFDPEQISYQTLGVSKERWASYIEMLQDAGYIKDVGIQKWISGEIDVDLTNIKITLKGLEYLAENSIMQRMYKVAKGIVSLKP